MEDKGLPTASGSSGDLCCYNFLKGDCSKLGAEKPGKLLHGLKEDLRVALQV